MNAKNANVNMNVNVNMNMNMSTNVIDARALRRSYGTMRALDDVSFSIPRGSLCGLIGPNGAGKTTLLSILATLDEDFDGDAIVAGASVRNDVEEVRRRLGFVPDHAPLYDALSVRELLAFFASAAGLPIAARKRAVDDVIALCGLEPILTRPAAGLSKGQAQRVCVGRALLHDPDVLLLDEPASGLDPRARIDLKELLKKLAARNKTVLISSHILTELGDFCDSILVLERGRVVVSGRIDEIGRSANSATTRRVLVEIAGDVEAAERALRSVDVREGGVRDVFVERVPGGAVLQCLVDGPVAIQGRMCLALVDAGVSVLRLVPEKVSLEALFLTVTSGAPRQDGYEGVQSEGGASC